MQEDFVDQGGCSSLGAANFGHHQALLGLISHSQVQQFGMSFLNPLQLIPQPMFWGLKPTRSLPKAGPTVEVGCRNVQPKLPKLTPCPSHQ